MWASIAIKTKRLLSKNRENACGIVTPFICKFCFMNGRGVNILGRKSLSSPLCRLCQSIALLHSSAVGFFCALLQVIRDVDMCTTCLVVKSSPQEFWVESIKKTRKKFKRSYSGTLLQPGFCASSAFQWAYGFHCARAVGHGLGPFM